MSTPKRTYPTFNLGQTVEWASQANGCTRIKRGQIVAVIPAGQAPSRDRAPGLFTKGTPIGMPRHHESYVVAVAGKTSRAKPKHYWPLVSQLRAVDLLAPEAQQLAS